MFDIKKEGGALWAGDADTYKEALRLEALCIEAQKEMKAGTATYGAQPAAGDAMPRMYQRKGNVGVVSVRGPLINAENDMTAYFNVSTYPAIREAMVYAAGDSQVNQILLDIESGGGAVSGVNDTAALVSQVNSLKPVTAFTGALCCSAAYWLGSAAGALYAGDPTAIVGSIGVITTHVSVAGALKAQGMDVTVLRVGDNKALGHSAEPLNDKAKAHILGQMNAVYDVFTNTVAANTGLPIASRDTWANGNDFMAADAEKMGLITGVQSYDKTYAQLAEPVDKAKPGIYSQDNNKKVQMKPAIKASLSAEQVAAIEAGLASDDAAKAVAAAALAAASTPEAKAAAEAEALQIEADRGAAEAQVKAAAEAKVKTEADAAAALAAGKAENELVTFLRGELAAANAKVLELTVSSKALEAKVADTGDSHGALCEIVRKSINTLAIALGGSAASLGNLSAMELVAKHSALAKDFTSKFPVGGVSAQAADPVEKTDTNVVSMQHRARVRATGLK